MRFGRALRQPAGFQQQQQVDVGIGEQLAPAVAAHGEQGQSGRESSATTGRARSVPPCRPPARCVRQEPGSDRYKLASCRRCGAAYEAAAGYEPAPQFVGTRRDWGTVMQIIGRLLRDRRCGCGWLRPHRRRRSCRRRSCRCAPRPSTSSALPRSARRGTTISNFTLGSRSTLYSMPAVDLLVALLAAMAAHFGDGHAIDADGLQRFLDFVQLERLDDGFDFFHGMSTLPRI